MTLDLARIPARRAVAVRVAAGQCVEVVNTWAFGAPDPDEWMSMEHSRLHMGSPESRASATRW